MTATAIGDTMQMFGFNTDLAPTSIVATNSGGTDLHWTVKTNQNVSNFGIFSFELDGKGQAQANPLVVTISNLGSNATLAHFVLPSQLNGGTVASFVAQQDRFIAVGDPNAVPEPSAVVLALVGIGGFGLTGFRRWRRKAAE
jgi:hypothetical protein